MSILSFSYLIHFSTFYSEIVKFETRPVTLQETDSSLSLAGLSIAPIYYGTNRRGIGILLGTRKILAQARRRRHNRYTTVTGRIAKQEKIPTLIRIYKFNLL